MDQYNFMLQKFATHIFQSSTHSEDLSKRIIIDDNVIFNYRSNGKESLTKREKGGNFVYRFEVKA